MPRSSDDQSRRMNIWGRNLLAYCEENGLAICNGRFGKDRGRGEYTCFSGPNSSVIDYMLVGVEFAACVVDFEVLHVLGSDHFPIKLSLQLSRMFNVPSLPHSSRISRAQAIRRLRQDWTDEETKTLKDRFCSEEILDKLKGVLLIMIANLVSCAYLAY